MSTKYSQFPQAIDINTSDAVVGLQNDENTRFTFSTILAWIRTTVSQFFVPTSRKVNNKALTTDITLDSSDIDYDNTGSGLTATDVQEAIDELAQGGGGTTVIANPVGSATDTLTKLQVESTIYSVSGGGSGGSAASVTYDHTTSGLTATNVQDAIDEVVVEKANDDEIGIVVNGNSSTQGADIGQYVILRNSTIPYRADGLYRAAKTIPANTAIDWSYIGSVDGGGLNSLNSRMPKCGNVPFTVSQNGATTVQVVFDVPFPQGTSYAVAVCQSGQYAYSNLDFGSTNRTETGFDVTVSSTRSGSFTGNVFWMAIPY